MYLPSIELVNILISNGFADITKHRDRNQYLYLIEKGNYDASSSKRYFRKAAILIFFNYIEAIYIYNKKVVHQGQINQIQLISILFFSQLPNIDRAFLNRNHCSIVSIQDFIDDRISDSEFMNQRTLFRFNSIAERFNIFKLNIIRNL